MLVNNVGGFWAHRHIAADGLEHDLMDQAVAAFPFRRNRRRAGAAPALHRLLNIRFCNVAAPQRRTAAGVPNEAVRVHVKCSDLAMRVPCPGWFGLG